MSSARRAGELAAIAAVVALQLALSWRLLGNATNFDEDVYLAAVDALHHGQSLGSDVFAAQFPGFYDLLRVLTSLVGLTIERARGALLVVFALGTIGAWLIGRRVGGVAGGAVTACVFVVAPPLDLFAPQVIADPPSLALSIFAVGLATLAGPGAALAAGAALCFAVSVKLTAITAIPAVVWFVRERITPALAGAAVVAVALLVAHATALGDLWSSGVTYHAKARSTPDVIPHPYRQILEQMPARTPFVWLAAGALVAAAVLVVTRRRAALDLLPLWLWAALAGAFLLVQRPLHYNHLLLFPGTLAIAAGATIGAVVPRRRSLLAVLALVLAAAYVQQWRRVDEARVSQPTADREAAAALARLTPSGALVADDRPIVAFLADRRVVGSLVDLAELRFETESLTQETVVHDLRLARAVVVSRALRSKRVVLRYLRRSFVLRYDAGGYRIYVRRH